MCRRLRLGLGRVAVSVGKLLDKAARYLARLAHRAGEDATWAMIQFLQLCRWVGKQMFSYRVMGNIKGVALLREGRQMHVPRW